MLLPDHTCQKVDTLLKQCRDHLELTVARHQTLDESYC